MRNFKNWMLAAILICGTTVFASCVAERDKPAQPENEMTLDEIKEKLYEMYGGENKQITDGNYDPSLAVKCVNGTFVGRKVENVTYFRGIPYVGQQPVGGEDNAGRLQWMLFRMKAYLRLIIMQRVPSAIRSLKQVQSIIRMKTASI